MNLYRTIIPVFAALAFCVLAFQNCSSYMSTRGTDAAQSFSQCFALENFGGVGDGLALNDVAWSKATNAVNSTNNCISIGPGKFRFSNVAVVNLKAHQNIKISGAGKGVTTLYWDKNSDGLNLARGFQSTFTISGMSLTTGVAGGGSALLLSDATGNFTAGADATSVISDMAIRGDDGINMTNYWRFGINATDVNLLNVQNTDVFGDSVGDKTYGLSWMAGTTNMLVVILNISGSYFGSCKAGVVLGNGSQGITISQTNFNAGQTGILANAGYALDQLTVSGSQFNTDLTQIVVNNMTDIFINNNLFFVPTSHTGISIGSVGNEAYGAISISSNEFRQMNPNSGVGIDVISSTSTAATIMGNSFTGLQTGAQFSSQLSSGIWNVQSNTFLNVTTPIANNAGSFVTVGNSAN